MENPPTSPIHTDPKTDITTITQTMQQGFKNHMSTAATQYIQPIFKTNLTSLNHSYTSTKSQHLPLNTKAVPSQPITHHTFKHTSHTHQHHQLTIIHLNTAYPYLHPYLHPKLLPIYHTTYHLDQLIKPTLYHTLNFIHFSSSISPHSPLTQTHTYAPRKEQQSDDQNHTHQHHTNAQQPSHNTFHKHS